MKIILSLLSLLCFSTFYVYGQDTSQKNKIQDSIRAVYNHHPDERIKIERELTHKFKSKKDKEALVFLELLKFGINIDDKSLSELDKFYEGIGPKYKDFPNVQARAYRTIGYHYFITIQNYEKAFDAYLKLEKLLRLHDEHVISNYSDFCAEIVTAYYKFKDYKTAIKIGEHGLTKAQNKWYIYNTLGLCYTELHQLDKAIGYLNKAVMEAENKKMAPIYRTIALGNAGAIYYLKGNFKKAKSLFIIDLNEALRNDDFGLAAGSAIPLSDILIDEKKYGEAFKLLNETRTYIAKSGQLDRLEKFFPIKSKYYQALNNNQKAIAYRDSTIKAIVRNDSVFNGLLVMRAQQKTDLEKIADEKNKLQNYKKLSELRILTLVAILILVIAFYLIVRKYRNRIEADKKRIEELNRIMELRQRLSADMHDDIGSTLSSISIYTHSLLMQPVAQHQQSTLEKIKENAQNVQESISDIIWSVNPNMDSMEQVVARMRSFGADITEYADVKFEFKTEAEVINLSLEMGVRKNLYLIYKEAVNNAVKYSACSQITINLKSSDNCFEMNICDDGKGFDLEKMKSGNGITNMRRRAESINAKFDILSLPLNGTRISLIINLISG